MTASAPQPSSPDLLEGARPLLDFISGLGLPPLVAIGLSGAVVLFMLAALARHILQVLGWSHRQLTGEPNPEAKISATQEQILAAIENQNFKYERTLEATDRARLRHALIEIDENGAARERAAVAELMRGNVEALGDLITLDDDELKAIAAVRDERLLRLRRNADLMAVLNPAGALELTERALSMAPSDFALKTLRGELLFRLDRLDEAAQVFTQVVGGKSKGARLQRIRAHDGLARISIGRGEIAMARKHIKDARALLEKSDPPSYAGVVFERQAEIAGIFGERTEAIRLRREARECFGQTKDTAAQARALIGFGNALLLRDERGHAVKGATKEATAVFDEALTLAQSTDNRREEARALLGKARIARSSGENKTAEALCLEALALARQSGDRRGEADALRAISLAQSKQGRADEAFKNQMAAYEIDQSFNRKGPMADDLANLARFAEDRGDFAEAERRLLSAIALQRAIGRKTAAADLYARLAMIAVKNKNTIGALDLLDRALSIYTAAGLVGTWRHRQLRQQRQNITKQSPRARKHPAPKPRKAAKAGKPSKPSDKRAAR